MATLLLDPHSEYRTRATENGYTNAQGNAIRSWGSTWKNYTSQDSRDSDANAFYFAQFYYFVVVQHLCKMVL